MNTYDQLGDPHSPAVLAALELRCGLCKAEPGQPCKTLTDSKPLVGRIVHYYRLKEGQ